jgi:hypothetical protein
MAAAVGLPACTGQAASGDRAAAAGTDPMATGRPQAPRDLVPYGGLGAWIDVYDYAPAYQDNGAPPPLSPDDLTEMARRGVKTVYLQATRWDDQSPAGIVDASLEGAFLERAHELGLRVVGWYLPRLVDPDLDLERSMQIVDFRDGAERFDGLAIDIEYTQGEGDPAKRNANLVQYSRALRAKVGDLPVAAVVLTAVHLEVVNPRFWPEFPYRDLRDLYDVWMPMAYWTLRNAPYDNAYNYVKESVDRLRNDLDQPDAPVAPVGGIADEMTTEQVTNFGRALHEVGALGGSFYDWNTMAPGKQAAAQSLFSTGSASSLPAPPAVKQHPSPDQLVTTTTAPPATAPPGTAPADTDPTTATTAAPG